MHLTLSQNFYIDKLTDQNSQNTNPLQNMLHLNQLTLK